MFISSRLAPVLETQDDVDRYVASKQAFHRKDAKAFSKKARIADWLNTNQLVYIPIEKWLGCSEWEMKYGLSELTKTAIILEVNELSSKIEKQRNDQKRQLKMKEEALAKQASVPKLPHSPMANTSGFFR